ncbi:DNA cytosine methyltransferase [Sphingobium sp. H39-3-25]|uniref:DNA cytosine methyltransferase n=1 Tax=Sphingobium arseniciresistens TaxID=3030834 RepID=UPI0023B97120|nr:DNA cytosine methyltransferase [Sphingobium arseniciresistens]
MSSAHRFFLPTRAGVTDTTFDSQAEIFRIRVIASVSHMSYRKYLISLIEAIQMLRVLSLFAGIGGFDLGLERTGGFKTVAFCEIDPFCQRVLAKHWPEVPCYADIRELTADRLAADGIAVDIICGGFPCQDLSEAGRRAGIDGDRSGLWADYARLIGELRPRVAIVENVPELLSGGGGQWFGRVLGDLAALGYDAVWHCIQAADLGAAHIRDRVWIAAYVPHTEEERRLQRWGEQFSKSRAPAGDVHSFSDEPMPARVADGVPQRMDRVGACGNAVVPRIPEMIGQALLAA